MFLILKSFFFLQKKGGEVGRIVGLGWVDGWLIVWVMLLYTVWLFAR